MVVEKSLTKNFILQSMEVKKIGQIQGRVIRRKPFLNPVIQLVDVYEYTKYKHLILNGSKTKKCYGITEERTDGMIDGCKPVFTPPLFQSGCIITYIYT